MGFRFTIRDLLWLMVVVGLLALWATERRYHSVDAAKMLKNNNRIQSRLDDVNAANRRLLDLIPTESGGRTSIRPELSPTEYDDQRSK